jgi:hypothetical protein
LLCLGAAQERARLAAAHPAPFRGPRLCFFAVGDDDDSAPPILDARDSVVCPVLIRQPDDLVMASVVSGGSQDRFMAAVSHNYALTFLCNARLCKSPSRSVKLREIAVRILRVASSFAAPAACGRRDDDYPERTLAVAVLTLHALVSELRRAPGDRERHRRHPAQREAARASRALNLAGRQLAAVRALQRGCTSGSSFVAAPAA